MIRPKISVIIVNFNGKELLASCLTSIFQSSYPKNKLEIIVVDNASTDDSVAFLKNNFPQIKLIESQENLGFTGGNNLGYEQSTGDFICLLNSDLKINKNFFANLLSAFKKPEVGLAAPKIYFDLPFIKIKIKSDVIGKNDLDNSTNFSPLGVLMEDVIASNKSLNDKFWYLDGFYPKQFSQINSFWTKGQTELLLPFSGPKKEEFIFTFHGYPTPSKKENRVQIFLGTRLLKELVLRHDEVKQVKLEIGQKTAQKYFQYLIQNAGNVVLRDGHGKDRGSIIKNHPSGWREEFYDFDHEYYQKPQSLLAICGAACLIRRKVIEKIGFFDGHYFMYYEDLDFSLRAWKMGFDITYVPTAIAFHKHKASTSKLDSSFFLNMIERNHLAFVLTHFPVSIFLREYLAFSLRLAITLMKSFAFRFRDNMERTRIWNQKAKGRREAFNFINQNFFRIYRNKLFWQQRNRRQFKELSKYLY